MIMVCLFRSAGQQFVQVRDVFCFCFFSWMGVDLVIISVICVCCDVAEDNSLSVCLSRLIDLKILDIYSNFRHTIHNLTL
jgi:hypothetical protein